MSSIVHVGAITFATDGVTAMKRGLRVKPNSSGVLVAAGVGVKEAGTLCQDVLVGQLNAAVDPANIGGSRFMVASAIIAAYDYYKGAADGKIVTAADQATSEGITLQASTADGEQIVCLPHAY